MGQIDDLLRYDGRRVVVTGIGLVSSLGIGTDANWAALGAGKSGVETFTKFDASQFATQIAGDLARQAPGHTHVAVVVDDAAEDVPAFGLGVAMHRGVIL